MKFAIVTRSDKNIKKLTDITHPHLKEYAKRCNADFINFDHKPPSNTWDNLPHFRLFRVYELLDKYERIIALDSDMIFANLCPNLFDVVPENKIGTIFEDKGKRKKERFNRMKDVQAIFGDVGWTSGYSNAGTFVFSRMHKEIFTPINGKYYTHRGSVDVHLGHQIRRLKLEIHELPYQFNHMTMFSEHWNKSADRFDSYLIHYAGRGIFEKKFRNKMDQMRSDYKKIYG